MHVGFQVVSLLPRRLADVKHLSHVIKVPFNILTIFSTTQLVLFLFGSVVLDVIGFSMSVAVVDCVV